MSNEIIKIDTTLIDTILDQLTPEAVLELLYRALEPAAKELKRQTESDLNSTGLKLNSKQRKGVRIRKNKTAAELSVSILGGWPKLYWWEKGTLERFSKGKDGKAISRGRLKSYNYFLKAKDDTSIETIIYQQLESELNKIINK